MALRQRTETALDDARCRAERVLQGNVRVASRLITAVQEGRPSGHETMRHIYSNCGGARLIGVTGPPGAGKSTLVGALIGELRRRELSVGVLAVDPSSPFSGGAVLGDRDRMEGFAQDPAVFIRSLASRGVTGGLCAAANDAVDIMDAMGKDVVLIETVGVGQSEIEIARIADCVLLTLVPGYGDSLQAMKAGILEVADIIVLNKADMEGAESAAKELASMGYGHAVPGDGGERWEVPVVRTVAMRGTGLRELVDEVFRHIEFSRATGWQEARHRERRTRQFLQILMDRIRADVMDAIRDDTGVRHLLDRIEALELDPYTATQELSGTLRRSLGRQPPQPA
jgi:LAO/AO transport system kinase